MRGTFVLGKHGQIYEPARLSSFALTTDINIRTLQGDCIMWGIETLPTRLYLGGMVSQGVSTNDAFDKSWLVPFMII